MEKNLTIIMKNFKSIIALLVLFVSFSIFAQVAPVGKKTLEVKQTIEEEYFKSLTTDGLGKPLMDYFYKSMPKKLAKYGFTDVIIEDVGKVDGTEELIFQVNIFDNITKNKFKIRLSMLSKNPKYIIKEIKIEDFPEGYFCNDIEKETDKFTNKTTFSSPVLNPISYVKTVIEEEVHTYIKIDVIGITANVSKKGVIILFEDGSKINKPDVDVNAQVNKGGDGFLYTAFFELNKEEIDILSQKNITDVRLFIYDREIKNVKLKEYMKCIKEK